MQIKTMLLGTIVLTGATIYSLNKIPDPVVAKPAHQIIALKATPVHHIHHASTHVAHQRTARPEHSSSAVVKQKPLKHKPYFVAGNPKKNYDD